MDSRPRQGLSLSIAALAGAALLITLLQPAPAPAQDDGPKLTKQQREKLERLTLRRQNAKQKRPNVIVIETDDQDNNLLGMETVRRLLAAPGVTFQNSYVTNPLCCPSRATFLTGQYTHNHGVVGSDPATGYNALDHSNTLAVWLRQARYRTGLVGKYLNGYGMEDGFFESLPDTREIPPGWMQWFALTAGTDQRRYRFRLNENGKIRYYGDGGANYVTDVLGSKVNGLIREWAPNPKPFFLWYTPTAPHGETLLPLGSSRDPQPALRHLGRYGLVQAPRGPSFDEEDVSDKPEMIRSEPKLGVSDIDDIDRRYRGRLESLLAVDEQVGRIVRLLKKTNDLRRTYIFFTSDNGLQLGAHRVRFKSYLYEESTRVPLIVRGPKFPPGQVRDQLVSNIDLAPTIVELTRARPGLLMDGVSLVDPSAGVGRDLLFESYDFNLFGVRSGNYAYNRYVTFNDDELYDLSLDPYELQSRHDDPAMQSVRASLAARLAQLRICAGASCR
jgi:N-acetylglucosamine-6-sulfatase